MIPLTFRKHGVRAKKPSTGFTFSFFFFIKKNPTKTKKLSLPRYTHHFPNSLGLCGTVDPSLTAQQRREPQKRKKPATRFQKDALCKLPPCPGQGVGPGSRGVSGQGGRHTEARGVPAPGETPGTRGAGPARLGLSAGWRWAPGNGAPPRPAPPEGPGDLPPPPAAPLPPELLTSGHLSPGAPEPVHFKKTRISVFSSLPAQINYATAWKGRAGTPPTPTISKAGPLVWLSCHPCR